MELQSLYTILLTIAILLSSFSLSTCNTHTSLLTKLAEAPAPAGHASATIPSNLTSTMAKKGCKIFASLLSSIPDVANTFEDDIRGGLTVFCPSDKAVGGFMPTYKNLTADGKVSLLLYHGVPFYNSFESLKSSNGQVNTLATDGTTKNYNFTVQNAGESVTLKTGVTTATILKTVIDEQPLAIYAIDEVLQPRELFKVVEPPSPAPAPASDTKEAGSASAPASLAPAAASEDQKAADDSSARMVVGRGWWLANATLATLLCLSTWALI